MYSVRNIRQNKDFTRKIKHTNQRYDGKKPTTPLPLASSRGKTSNGIDCSALIQIYFYFNRIFFPRDTKNQIKFCKKKISRKFIKGDIIFWKGHVGLCINSSKFIHAYGPKKKVLIMPINHTINMINRTASLMVKKISNIEKY